MTKENIPIIYDAGRAYSPAALALWRGYAEKLAWGADSILAQLSEREFREGMRLLNQPATTAGNEPVPSWSIFFAFRRR